MTGSDQVADKKCTSCEKSFKKMSKKKIHMVTHTKFYKNLSIEKDVIWSEDRTKLSCLDCGRKFNLASHMKAHIAQVHYKLHNIKNLDKLDISDIMKTVKMSKEASQIYENKDDMHQTVKVDTSKTKYKENLKFVDNKFREFRCDICPNSFRKNSYLRLHQLSVHSTDRKFACLLCSKGCVSKGELVTHMKCHTGERTFICDICSDTFISNADLKAHRRKHDGTMLQCQACEKQFSRTAHLNSHVKYVHLKASTDIRSERRRQLKRQKLVKQSSMDLFHASEIHTNSLEMNRLAGRPEPKKVKCQECDGYYSLKSLKEHALNVHIRRSKNQNLVKQSEEFLNFFIDLNAEFSGPELVLVLGFVQDLKERSQSEPLKQIREDGQNGNYRKVFEDLGVLQTNRSIQTIYVAMKEGTFEIEEGDNVKKERAPEKEEKKEKLKTEKVKKEQDFEDSKADLEETNTNNLLIEGTSIEITALFEDEIMCNTQQINTETIVEMKINERMNSKHSQELVLKQENIGMKQDKKKEPNNEMCAICGKVFSKMSKKRIHMLTHNQLFKNLSISNEATWSEDRTKLSCNDCSKTFNLASHMKTHIALVHYQMHNIENLETLDLSDTANMAKTLGLENKKTDHPIKKQDAFFCEFCFEEFSCSGYLEKHKLVKHEGLGYNCDSCDYSTCTPNGLLKHQNSKHSVKTENVEAEQARNCKSKEAIQCELCLKQFARKAGLKRHKYFKHESLGYNCDQCDHAARTPLGLLKHKSSSHGITSENIPDDVLHSSFKCKECGALYNSTTALRRHTLVHTGERPFPCNKCDKKFRQKSTLDGHIGTHN